jgi:hypothetical protein
MAPSFIMILSLPMRWELPAATMTAEQVGFFSFFLNGQDFMSASSFAKVAFRKYF